MRPKDLYILLYDRIRRVRRRFDPNFREHRVLDIGSGHRPHIDATHLVDLYTDNDHERGKKLKRIGKVMIQANVEALPFKGKTFQYIYASHVLEHTTDPSEACRELVRVGKSGYIETPDPFYEQGYGYPGNDRGWSFHKWFVWLNTEGVLIFEQKTGGLKTQLCKCRHANFVHKIYDNVADLNKLHKILPRECNYTCFEWKDKFEFRVLDNSTRERERVSI